MKDWFDIRAAGPLRAEIFIYGDIVSDAWFDEEVTAKTFIDAVSSNKGKDLDIRINSSGGNVFQGLAIYNTIRAHPKRTRVYIDGVAASIAGVIAMAGDEVYMAENAFLMLHNPWGVAIGDADDLRKQADIQDKIRDGMIKSYQSRVAMTDAEITAVMDAETWYTAEEAVSLGFADSEFPAMEMAASVNIERFSNAPECLSARANPLKPSQPEKIIMETTEVKDRAAGGGGEVVDIAKVQATARMEAISAEKKRRGEIRAIFQPINAKHSNQFQAELDEALDDPDCTPDKARELLLVAMGKESKPIPHVDDARIEMIADAGEKRIEGCTNWLLARAGVVKHDPKNEFRGSRLVDIARGSLEAAGVSARGLSSMDIAGAAMGVTSIRAAMAGTHSTSDFTTVLENTMHKVLQAAFARAPFTWRMFCKTGEVSDFRAHNRYRMGSFGNLDTILENGEFKAKTIGDAEKESITATTKGNVITISRQMIVNDDLGAFTGLSNDMGYAAGRTIEADVYTSLTSNSGTGPTLGDAVVMFHANHTNIGTGGVPSITTIDEARRLMAQQTDPDGNDYLDLRPSVFLGPLSLETSVRQLFESSADPTAANANSGKSNPIRNWINPDNVVSSPRLSGTRWYMFADPMVAPVMEVVFLDGVQSPFLDQQEGFLFDGVTYKVRLDYGVGGVGYRGAVTNAGV